MKILQNNPIFTRHERELIQQLLDDANVLASQFSVGIPKPSATRATLVPILRRWIVEELFYRAQRLILQHKISFDIRSNAQALKLCKTGVYEHWMGILDFGQIGIGVGKVNQKYVGPNGVIRIQMDKTVNIPPAPQDAKAFFTQRMFYWKNEFYTRADVIKLHANALGGVHYDPLRKQNNKKYLHEIPNYFGFEVKVNTSQMLIGADIEIGRADPERRPNIYDATELIAMDTSRIFANGIKKSEPFILGMLK